MTELLSFTVNHNDKTVIAEFSDKQTLHLEYFELEKIQSILGSYYTNGYNVCDHYELYLNLVPFTTINNPVYL